MDNFQIISEGFIFIDSEGKKSLTADGVEDLADLGYFVSIYYNKKAVVASCPVSLPSYFDNEGAVKIRAREICLQKLKKGLK